MQCNQGRECQCEHTTNQDGICTNCELPVKPKEESLRDGIAEVINEIDFMWCYDEKECLFKKCDMCGGAKILNLVK